MLGLSNIKVFFLVQSARGECGWVFVCSCELYCFGSIGLYRMWITKNVTLRNFGHRIIIHSVGMQEIFGNLQVKDLFASFVFWGGKCCV